MASKKSTCDFCGRPASSFIPTNTLPEPICLCPDCIALCTDIADSQRTLQSKQQGQQKLKGGMPIPLPKPRAIKEALDEYVIGQDNAKTALSVAVYNHYKRINDLIIRKNGAPDDGVELNKSNVLLLGPTGVGKTLLAQTLARLLQVPFAISDATTLTEAGYVGEDVENILLRLIQAADFDIERAERGIIYIDEIDKIARRSENRSITRDVSGEGVQQALLKIVEGTLANVPPQGGRKHPNQEALHINTANILFICGGAFDGLNDIVESRLGRAVVGYTARRQSAGEKDASSGNTEITPHDLVKFGIIPELVGRIPVVVALEPLDKSSFVRILREPKNALLRQYQKLFALDGVKLEFSDDAVDAIAEEAVRLKTGARGLRSIAERIMMPYMYSIPSDGGVKELLITRDIVLGIKSNDTGVIKSGQ